MKTNNMETNVTTINGTAKPKNKSKSNIPSTDSDFLALAKIVADKWKTTPDFKLTWIDEPTFKTLVDGYATNLGNRLSAGSGRSIQTQTLAQTNKQIDEAVESVKAYLIKKFKKENAAARYTNYGIIKENGNYRLPKDNDKRLTALPLMASAITADGFDKEEFGTSFWKNITNTFTAALKNTTDTARNISNKAAIKTTDKEKIHKIIIAIKHLIYANYPDTSDKTLREWGFIKQNF